jgi:hypothetical protein
MDLQPQLCLSLRPQNHHGAMGHRPSINPSTKISRGINLLEE